MSKSIVEMQKLLKKLDEIPESIEAEKIDEALSGIGGWAQQKLKNAGANVLGKGRGQSFQIARNLYKDFLNKMRASEPDFKTDRDIPTALLVKYFEQRQKKVGLDIASVKGIINHYHKYSNQPINNKTLQQIFKGVAAEVWEKGDIDQPEQGGEQQAPAAAPAPQGNNDKLPNLSANAKKVWDVLQNLNGEDRKALLIYLHDSVVK